MSIKAMKQALEALEVRCGTHADERKPGGVIEALRTAIQQAEAKTDEPVAWLYIEDGEVMFGHPNGYRPPDARPLVFGDTHPAPGVPDDVVRDAERYRWLLCNYLKFSLPDEAWKHGSLDAAIDAAMTASQVQKGGE